MRNRSLASKPSKAILIKLMPYYDRIIRCAQPVGVLRGYPLETLMHSQQPAAFAEPPLIVSPVRCSVSVVHPPFSSFRPVLHVLRDLRRLWQLEQYQAVG